MKILYCTEINSDNFTIDTSNFENLDKYDIHIIGQPIYCCEDIEKNFWLELIESDNINEETFIEHKNV